MATLTITIPSNFIQNMNQLMANVQKMQQLTNQLIQKMQATPAAQNLYRVHYAASQTHRLYNVMQKIYATLQRALDSIINSMGTVAKYFLRGLSVAAGVLGPIISAAVTITSFAVSTAIFATTLTLRISRWFWDKIIGLGDSILQDYLAASGSRSTIGGLRAFRTAFGMVDDPGLLPGMVRARGDVMSPQYAALQMMKVMPQNDTTGMMVQAALSAATFMKSQQLGQELRIANALMLTSLFNPQTLLKLKNLDDDELRLMKENYERYKPLMQITEKAAKGWINFRLQVKAAGVQIMTVIANQLADKESPIVQSLTSLSQSITRFFKVFTDKFITKEGVDTLGKWIEDFGKFLSKPETIKTIEDFIEDIRSIVKSVMEAIKYLKQMIDMFQGKVAAQPDLRGRRALARRTGIERPVGAPRIAPPAPIERFPGRRRFTEKIGIKRPSGAPPIAPEAPIDRFPGRKRFHEKIGIEQPPNAPRISPRPVRPGKSDQPSKGGGTDSRPVRKSSSASVNSAIDSAAKEANLDPKMMHAVARIESGYDPNNSTGSYKGLFQLSETEFRNNGGQGSIYDPVENARAAAKKLVKERAELSGKLGRPVTDAELYMAHQQGVGGATQHLTHPDRPAWQSMYATGEGQQKGEAWAKRAIWGNLSKEGKAKFGSVENVTSGDFTEWWRQRYNRELGGKGPQEAGNFPSRGYETRRGEPGEFNVAKTGVYGPPGPANITSITLKNGQTVQVNKAVAERYRGFLNDLIDRGYPLKVGAGSGYQYRANVNNPGSLSMHSYGAALDVNPDQNPNKGNRTNLPDDVEEMAWRRGLSWGGRFGDPMHFEPMSDAAWEHKKQLLRERGISDQPPIPSTTSRAPAEVDDFWKDVPLPGQTKTEIEARHPVEDVKVDNRSDDDISSAKTSSDNDDGEAEPAKYAGSTKHESTRLTEQEVEEMRVSTKRGVAGVDIPSSKFKDFRRSENVEDRRGQTPNIRYSLGSKNREMTMNEAMTELAENRNIAPSKLGAELGMASILKEEQKKSLSDSSKMHIQEEIDEYEKLKRGEKSDKPKEAELQE